MKTFLLTLIICLFNFNLTEIVGKYQIESERSGDLLELKKDGTYKYESRGDSCWTWSEAGKCLLMVSVTCIWALMEKFASHRFGLMNFREGSP